MAVFVSDSFTEASDVDVLSHTGEIGASYSAHPDAGYTASFTLDSATGRIFAVGSEAYYASGVPPSPDYYVEAPFFLHTAASQNIAICARMDTSVNTMYIVRLNNGTTWEMRSIIAGTPLTIGSSIQQVPSVGGSSLGRFILNGNQLSFLANGLEVISPITDNSITSAGRVGFRNAGTATATTGAHLSSIEAGTLNGGSSQLPYFGGGHSPYRRIIRVSSY